MGNKYIEKTKADTSITYDLGSNMVKYSGKVLYLTRILWEENLTYEDIKEYIDK